MANLQELFQGMQMLQDNVKGLALQDAMSQANDQVYQIRNSQAKDEEKIAGLRNVAQDFTMRLTGMGARPEQIQQVSQAIAPPLENLKTPQDAALMGAAYGFPSIAERGQKALQQQQDWKMQQIAAAQTFKINNKYQDNLTKEKENFAKIAKPDLETLEAARKIQDLNDPSQIPNFLTQNMGLISAIRSSTNRVTNLELTKSIPNQDLASRANRMYDALIDNKPLPADVDALKALGQVFMGSAAKRIDQRATTFAKSRASRTGLSAPDFKQQLASEHLFDQPGYMQQQQATQPGQVPSSTTVSGSVQGWQQFVKP